MLKGTEEILRLYQNDEFKPIIVVGGHGLGKSSYAASLLADVYGFVFTYGDPPYNFTDKDADDYILRLPYKPYWNNFGVKNQDGAWEINPVVRDWFESHMGFHPREVIDEWEVTDKRDDWLLREFGSYPRRFFNDWQYDDKKRDVCYEWDDSGLWLNSLDFQDPFVKDTGKYMQVVRSDWACVIFTAISAEDITSKIRGLKNAIIVEITKYSDSHNPYRRIAEAYILKKSYKGRVWKDTQWRDAFSAHVPDPFFSWYHPLRARYASIAKQLMRKKLEANKDLNIVYDNNNGTNNDN